MSTDDLIAWLNAQIDEDERRAKWAATVIDGNWDSWEVVAQQLFACCDTVPRIDRVGQHLMHTSDPARALREVEAKRRLLDLHKPVTLHRAPGGQLPLQDITACEYDTNPDSHGWADFPCDTVRLLTSVYSDRPGYRDEWGPQ